MDANDYNILVWRCDLFDIEEYNKEKENTCNFLNPAAYFCLFPIHDQDFQLHMIFCLFLTVQLFEVVVHFVDIGGIVDHLCLNLKFEDIKGVIIIRKSKKTRQHNGQKKKGQKDK